MFRFIALSLSPPSTTLSRTARQGQRMSTLSLSPLIFLLAASPPRASIALSLALALALFLPPSLCGSIDKSCRWPPTTKLPTYLPAKNLLPSPPTGVLDMICYYTTQWVAFVPSFVPLIRVTGLPRLF